ncbi:5'-nucleotidase C-terminal domain-containing protein [Streptomyces synnematoformans]|uniref:5'-nucleotidase C-terminal domain-containing protein n=1 Tax=Streptomyces synnematoformans TaxID=415721 RepID=UPI0004890B81
MLILKARPAAPRRRRSFAAGAAAVLGLSLLPWAGVAAVTPSAAQPGPVPVQLLALNDLHGNLDPVDGPAGSVSRITESGDVVRSQAGGVAGLATLLKDAREGQQNTLTVGAGDLIGGSPLLSANFHDEPTIDALEELGLDVASVGNHEFDEGPDELLRIAHGGCHPADGCAVPDEPYDGADFPYLAANVTRKGSAEPLLPPYWIKTLPGGERIGFIGLITRHAPDVISAARIRDVEFHDEVETVERYSRELTEMGVAAQTVLIHEGGAHGDSVPYNEDCDDGGPGAKLGQPIRTLAESFPPDVDVIVSGHSHEPYVCTVPDPAGDPRVVTQAASFGRTYTDLRFALDPGTGDVLRGTVEAANHPVLTATPQDPAMAKLIGTWRERSAELEKKPVGYITDDLPGRGSTAPERPLGGVIADGQVEATRGNGAEIAMIQPGGIRADLTYTSSGDEGDGVVTYAEAFRVSPFETGLVTMTLTGDQLVEVLRQGFSGANEDRARFMQPSAALSYAVDLRLSGGARLDASSVRVAGQPVVADREYRVTVNEFLAEGGNGFTEFKDGTDRRGGDMTDTAALVSYLQSASSPQSPLAPPSPARIEVRE